MSVALQVVQIIFQSVAIIFMICFMFIGIWSFIIFIKMFKNQRIQNFLLEKINTSISSLEKSYKNTKNLDNDISVDTDFNFDNFLDEDDNIIKFDDNVK
ncbi:DUF6709 family protein [Clostridium celatum]|uniref:Uncharacterized protein n=1 Tax=Clostridium celatum DSM 1785 TaxID=545697 RepID=L1Q458_9CLOT|nr:DUF6709 family protein [Clostridium celatum]EKY22377.1 hypothetical protein HMPREF0216_03265 [Clostridium celatum DSM 1785]MCE9655884.1 hypothetical protein [Clostridium celatum]MDU2266314.1 DUF6709 family protein [Clostridium celatum]MDU3721682.1 DUF6709 family protein [Clostridium celatum]MDU6296563.1 DUF6709 family protein [Clostridium celatum]